MKVRYQFSSHTSLVPTGRPESCLQVIKCLHIKLVRYTAQLGYMKIKMLMTSLEPEDNMTLFAPEENNIVLVAPDCDKNITKM